MLFTLAARYLDVFSFSRELTASYFYLFFLFATVDLRLRLRSLSLLANPEIRFLSSERRIQVSARYFHFIRLPLHTHPFRSRMPSKSMPAVALKQKAKLIKFARRNNFFVAALLVAIVKILCRT